MKRRPLTARGWGCLLSGILLIVAANVLSARPLLYVGLLLAALPVICLLVVRLPRRRGEVHRQVSTDVLAVGETSRVNVRFDLYAFGIPRGTWRDTLPAAVHGDARGDYPEDALRYDLEGFAAASARSGRCCCAPRIRSGSSSASRRSAIRARSPSSRRRSR
ncbi:hypothetical protein [Microbacterium suwonense]|uniref:DUF58 domain-containing protein n=1 Tax=Microbacterium suwonense TaxID=683047 RepID=A0ABM8FPU7_9MICO|nr:hypothetical protein [Microbacterium suwonense]BDZ37431.1 hypothetical protein GCM10025863_00450 [Microbacterium suwonense]BDZ40695.1 hypothetical protein GCM10025863_33090 [Microbacterium suwonense]